MKLEIKKLPKNLLETRVSFTLEEIKPFYKKALQKIAASFSLEGFRKGKGPEALIKKEVGDYKIMEETIPLLLEEKYPEILKTLNEKIKFDPVSGPVFQVEKLAPENELVLRITFALMPKVKLTNYKKIKIKEERPKMSEEEIKKVLEGLQEKKAKQVRKKSEAKLGDLLKIDLELSNQGVVLENGSQKDFSLILGKEYLLKEISENLIGSRDGETKEFSLDYPENYPDQRLQGKKIDFKVKIKEIFELIPPALDNFFAKSFNFGSLEEMKKQIEKNILSDKERKIEEKFELKIVEEIIKQSEFEEIPSPLLEKEILKMILELKESAKTMFGLEFDDYLKMIKKTEEELKKEILPQAEERVKAALIIREIALKEKIKAGEDELNSEKEKIRENLKENFKETPELENYLENIIISRKTINFLKSLQ